MNGFVSSPELRMGKKFQNYEGRIVLRGDIVNDDSGNYAVFTDQGAPSHMMTSKVLDVISRVPGCSDKQVIPQAHTRKSK